MVYERIVEYVERNSLTTPFVKTANYGAFNNPNFLKRLVAIKKKDPEIQEMLGDPDHPEGFCFGLNIAFWEWYKEKVEMSTTPLRNPREAYGRRFEYSDEIPTGTYVRSRIRGFQNYQNTEFEFSHLPKLDASFNIFELAKKILCRLSTISFIMTNQFLIRHLSIKTVFMIQTWE